ncbi:MAG: efflux RND transporter periplasmic adaptor subunit [Bacteroidota bacterium]|nr:efflux RND transporter periplasmic adaptor subunit [Bacteroidota bacterium]
MNNKVIFILIAILLLSIVGLIAYKEISKKTQKPKIEFIKPEIGTIERKIIVPGSIIPGKEIQVKSQISGVLDELFISIGDKVTKGQKIAKVKPVTDPVSYERLERQYKIAEANFQNREQVYKRNKTLFNEKAITKPEFEEAEKQYEISKHEMFSIKKEINMTSAKDLGSNDANIIKATSEGTILELPIKVGGAVMARSSFHEGTNLATIANLNSLLFYAKILENDVSYLYQGMLFDLVIGAMKDAKIKAELLLISPKGALSDGSVKFEVWAKILSDKEKKYEVRAGYSANAEIVLESRRNAIILNEKYIDFKNDSAFVSIVDTSKGTSKLTFIKTGISDGNNVEILTKLTQKTLIKK